MRIGHLEFKDEVTHELLDVLDRGRVSILKPFQIPQQFARQVL